ncbi:MAG: GDSL-type esterase/lipase family protein [Ignavibacteriaceae bacterium]
MNLTTKQKNWIEKNRGKHSVNKMSKILSVPREHINEFLHNDPDKAVVHKKTPKLFYLILLMIPVLFFVILELSLRAFNYGINTDQWITIHHDKYVANPQIARRYFYNTKNIPETIGDAFDQVKQPNSFRVFILGGSSAAGYPYMPVGSFSRYIKKRLELVYPESRIEVVNISIAATNSYTIRDLFPGVLEQKPDLILIYAGHNEYYGALGIGSNEYLGASGFVVNSALYLNRFKTFEFLRNIIKSISGLFSSGQKSNSGGTLMSQMVKDQYIPYNSDKYNAGIEQFEGNMKDILQMAKEANVNVMLGTVVSNLKDQHPFISLKETGQPSAEEVFKHARELLREGESKLALDEFIKAKDLDALRFRAPGKINSVIKQLAKEYNDDVVDIDSVFNASSPDGIVGANLIVDQLHPSIDGNHLIGKLFYEEMQKLHYLPETKEAFAGNFVQDSLARAKFDFSKFDSALGAFEVKSLKNDWPFVEKNKKKPLYRLFDKKNFIDSVAADVVSNKMSWEKGEGFMCQWYLKNKDIHNFTKQANVLLSQFPFSTELYDLVIRSFINLNEIEPAYSFLLKRYKLGPNAYTAKWLGVNELSKNRTDMGINYLEESLRYSNNDPQVLFSLSKAYLNKKEYNQALNTVNMCLSIAPGFTQAKILQRQLTDLVKTAN